MNPENWKKIEDIFQEALDCPPAERQKFILSKTDGDAELQAEVEKLVARYEVEEEFLESPVWTDSGVLQSTLKNKIAASLDKEIPPSAENESFIGRQIKVYQLKEELGRGGMGVVYRAERNDGEFYQQVAIKLIKRGMDTDFIIKRFRHERQILANFNHPFIARLLDGGTTEDGLPYFVMEFIQGKPFFKYCKANDLNLREKLKLFLSVCHAVAYAHDKKVIHRDIKPGNILVGNDGTPKLLDFGIAKILDPDSIHESVMPTATQMRLMTPEYASPEQVRGDDITPASDQYSLGVLLFELVTGARPYKFPSRAPHEIARIICEEEPTNPSSADYLSTTGSGNGVDNSSITDFNFNDDFCGKLDRIILKTLRKNPSERYDSIKELSTDIERLLGNQPVRAENFSHSDDTFDASKQPSDLKPGQKSIAVFPLHLLNSVNGEEASGGQFLSIGLADALITRLSNVRQFVVHPTSSVLRFGTENTDAFVAGKELRVNFVLTGNILRTEKRIRVSMQLLDVEKQATVWAERFDEDFTDVLAFEDKISARVADLLVPQLTAGERQKLAKRGTDNAEAYEAYMRGRFHFNNFTEESLKQAIFFYQKAVQLDPNYAIAYAGIADYFMWLGIFGVLPPKKTYETAKQMARRAIEIDDKLAEAYAALGFAQLCGDYDWETSEKNIRRAIEINPNYAVAYNWLAIQLYTASRFDEGIEYAKTSIKLDPLTYQNYRTLSWGFYFSRRFDESLGVISKTIEKFPMTGTALANRSWLLRAMGRTDAALHDSDKALETAASSIFVQTGHAQALAAAGKTAESEKLIAKLEANPDIKYVSYYQIALAHCYTNDKGKALDALKRAFSDRDGWLVWLNVEPALDLIRGEKRFAEIIRQVNPPGYKPELETISDAGITEIDVKRTELQPNEKPKSIAVLPFKILNDAADEDSGDTAFLSVGLADAVITRLSNMLQFAVRPTSSILRFGGEETDSFEAGEELKVQYVVDGTVIKTRNRFRVSVQLLDIDEQSTIWAERLDEDFTDVLHLEDKLSTRVLEALLPKLTGKEREHFAKRGTDNPEAYEAYLRGRYHFNIFSDAGFQAAIDYYQQAVELDPNYALAYAGIADYYVWISVYDVAPMSGKAQEAALHAISIDDSLSEAYAALGLAVLYGEYDWQASEKYLNKAIELNPNNAIANLWFSHNLYSQGRFTEGDKYIKRSIELDPLAFQNHNTHAWSYYFSRRFDEALAKSEQLILKYPEISHGYHSRATYLNFLGRPEEALKLVQRALELSNDGLFNKYGIAQSLGVMSKRDEAEKLIRQIKALSEKRRFSYFQAAMVYCFLKDKDKAFEYFEQGIKERETILIWMAIEPSLDILRDDERYFLLLEKMNHPLAAEQRRQRPAQVSHTAETLVQDKAIKPAVPKKRLPAPLKYALLVLLLALSAFVIYNIASHITIDLSTGTPPPSDRWENTFASSMNIRRLTTTGKDRLAAVSPNGDEIAYVSNDKENQSLWIRKINSGEARQIVAPNAVYFTDVKFSPDGTYVYYVPVSIEKGGLYRVSINGGAPQEVLPEVSQRFAFSPDGRQLAFEYSKPDGNDYSLQLAELGSDLSIKPSRTLLSINLPDFFTGDIAFSPDGTKIVYPRSQITNSRQVINLFVCDIKTGEVTKLGDHDFQDIYSISWRKYTSEIVISAAENDSSAQQLWLVSYPSGKITRLTNDFSNYIGTSLSADSSTLASAKSETLSNIWTTELSESNAGFEAKSKQITKGIEHQDGIGGVSWTKDNRILYVAGVGTDRNITIADTNGASSRVLPTGAVNPSFPLLTTDGLHLIYADEKGQDFSIWKFDMTTNAVAQVTSNYAVTPALTPDNNSLIYSTLLESGTNKLTIHSKSLNGNGSEKTLSSSYSVRPIVSSDGRFIACNYRGEESGDTWQIAILPVEGGAPIKVLKAFSGNRLENPQHLAMAWSPDGRYIFYALNVNNVSNIFRITTDGNNAITQMTYFTSDIIFDFSLSPDGKRAVLSRGTTSSDIVIFKNAAQQ